MMAPNVFQIGLTRRASPARFDELCSHAGRSGDVARDVIRSPSDEVFVLKTCERFEIYTVTEAVLDRECPPPTKILSDVRAAGLREGGVRSGSEAIRNLFRVAAGLDSRIVGETDIVAQIRSAAEECREAGTIGPVLDRAVGSALRAGRRVRQDTDLGRVAASCAHLAAAEVFRRTGGWEAEPRIAIVGAGAVARSLLSELGGRHAGRALLLGRYLPRVQELAGPAGAASASIDELPSAISSVDALILAASSRTPIVTAAEIQERRRGLLIIDLGVPANASPDVASLEDVNLVRLDDLAPARSVSHDAIRVAERIVERTTACFLDWLGSRERAPADEPGALVA